MKQGFSRCLKILMICLLANSLVACSYQPEDVMELITAYMGEHVEEEADDSEDEAEPASGRVWAPKSDFEVESYELVMEYTLTQEEIEAFYDQSAYCMELVQAKEESDLIESEVEKLYNLGNNIRRQAMIAEILYYCHMADEEALNHYWESTEALSQIDFEYNNLLREIYNADVSEYQDFFEDWTETDLKLLSEQNEECVKLELRNAEILTEFYSLSEEELEEKIGGLYSEFVTNSNRLAVEYDFSNYYEYASTALYLRDYGQEERELFRKYVKDYVVPVYNVVSDGYEEAVNELTWQEWSVLKELLYAENAALSTDYMNNYLNTLQPGTAKWMQHMFQKENYILADAEDAYEGAFTVIIEEPFCYFGPEYQSLFVMVHEMGHYYAELYAGDAYFSYDLAETQSQGNEALLWSYLKDELPEKIYNALVYYELYYFTDSIVQSTIMDEFEEFIYNEADVTGYTVQDYDRIMYEIISEYGVEDSDNYMKDSLEWLWRNIGIDYPVYYLSYAVSAMATINLYSESMTDYEAATESYRILCEEVDWERNFTGTLEKAGIMSVFEEEAYHKLLKLVPMK